MRRRHRKQTTEAELNITPFLNLMIVLVPVLLLSMVFTQTRILELTFADGSDVAAVAEEDDLRLHVILREDGIEVGDNQRGRLQRFDTTDEGHDFEALRELLRDIKARVPGKRDIALLVSPGTDYQTLVTAMDHIRSYPDVVAMDVVRAELFPDIALGDAPEPAGDAPGEGGS